MTWARQSTGEWLHSGAVRSVLMASGTTRSDQAFRLEIPDPDSPAMACVLSSPDGGTCMELGLSGSNAIIRTVKQGAVQSASQSSAHGLSSGVPYIQDVIISEGTVGLYLNGSDTAVVEESIPASLADFEGFGWSADADGVIVNRARNCAYTATLTDRMNVAVVLASGKVYWSKGSSDLAVVTPPLLDPNADVWAVEFRQKIYAGDGKIMIVIDPTATERADFVKKAVPTAGTLPGAEAGVAGSCTATWGAVYFDRLVLGGVPTDPQNVYFSAEGAPLDWDYGADSAGRAYGASTDRSRVGEPTTGAIQLTNGSLVIGTERGAWLMLGDLALGVPQLSPILRNHGIPNGECLRLIEEGFALALTPIGLVALFNNATANPLTNGVLTEGIQIPQNEWADYRMMLGRDVKRQTTHVFLTPRAATVKGLHFAYDERIGRWQQNQHGPVPDEFASVGLDPTATGQHNGELLIGTRDGRVLKFDDSAKSDDGEAISCRFTLTPVEHADASRESIFERFLCILGADSDDATVKVYGGATTEAAFDSATRTLLVNETVTRNYQRVRRRVRAPALIVEVSNTTVGESVTLDNFSVDVASGRMLSRFSRAGNAPAAPNTPPAGELGGSTAPAPDTPDEGPGAGQGDIDGEEYGPVPPNTDPRYDNSNTDDQDAEWEPGVPPIYSDGGLDTNQPNPGGPDGGGPGEPTGNQGGWEEGPRYDNPDDPGSPPPESNTCVFCGGSEVADT